ncbi:MAG TPA: ATP-binding protein [Acidimicrobiales bacterium]|jgi:anti-sigma regulatory factor (Ser/Thr protein kinase)|nr:ATP-binding protein [Acidimicrobiales bacterium]HKH24716.1 ATP-binding protein [Acidimicrobiales bacterium]
MVHQDGPARPTGGDHADVRHLTARFPNDPAEVAHARRAIGDALAAWGFDGEGPLVVLAASEMVTNAVMHGDGDVEVTLGAEDDVIRLEVGDSGGGEPALRSPDPTGEIAGGWGLHLVREVADEWGTRVEDGRTVVWMTRRTGRAGA